MVPASAEWLDLSATLRTACFTGTREPVLGKHPVGTPPAGLKLLVPHQ